MPTWEVVLLYFLTIWSLIIVSAGSFITRQQSTSFASSIAATPVDCFHRISRLSELNVECLGRTECGLSVPLGRTLELAASQETCRQSDISSALHWNGMGMPLLLSSLGTSENSERKNKCIFESYRSKDQKSCFKASTSAGLQCINKVSPFRFSTTIWYRNNNQSGGVET